MRAPITGLLMCLASHPSAYLVEGGGEDHVHLKSSSLLRLGGRSNTLFEECISTFVKQAEVTLIFGRCGMGRKKPMIRQDW